MKNLLFGIALLTMAAVSPAPARAEINVSIGIGIPLPPPIVIQSPPEVIVLPDTDNVYVAPSFEVDLFFHDGYWWRPWQGRWYRSSYYDRGWRYYDKVPVFYYDVEPRWRTFYKERHWHGHRWDHKRISHRDRERHWKDWKRERRWERRGSWGVADYKPRPRHEREKLRYERERYYKERPEVRQHFQERKRAPEKYREAERRQEHRDYRPVDRRETSREERQRDSREIVQRQPQDQKQTRSGDRYRDEEDYRGR
jgi:hypothetical protein